MYKPIKELNLIGWLTIVVLILLSQTNLLAAGTGDLKGIIVDATTGDGLPGANVYLEGTAIGGATDLDGFYHIMNIPAGTYDLVVLYIGYKEKTISIEIVADQRTEQHVEMTPSFVEIGETINVSAQRVGQQGAINQQLTADALMNVVSADRIQELPDANVAESVGRIPGVSIQREAGEASKIVIRGLEPKLNAITINGIKIPATSSGTDASGTKHNVSKDMGDRAVDLSMMSADLLEAIEVYKAPTPDMDAEAVGGIVNLKVKKAPQERTMLFRGNGGFNQLNNDYSDYKMVGQYSQRILENKLGFIGGLNVEKTNRGSERFNAGYDTDGIKDSTGFFPIDGQNMYIRDTKEIRKRFGGYLTIDYALDNGVIWFTNFYSQTSRNPFSVTKRYDPNEESGVSYDVRYQEIDLSGLSSSLNGEQQVWGMDIDWVLSRYATQTNNSYDMEMNFRTAPNWDEDILDRADVDTYIPAANDSLQSLYLRNNYFRPDSTSQTDYTAELNFKIPFVLSQSLGGFLKFGGKYSQSDRERVAYEAGIFNYYLSPERVADAQALYPVTLDINADNQIMGQNFLSSHTASDKILNNNFEMFPLFEKGKVTDWYRYQKSLFNATGFPRSDAYDLEENVYAGYAMAKLNFGQMLSVIPGVRYEHSDNTYNGVWSTIGTDSYGQNGLVKDTTSTKNYGYLFPHLHIKYKPLPWFDLRLSAVKTLARPNYYWMIPWTRISSERKAIDRGNPDLKESTSWNYDVSTSFYSNTFGLLTIGGFYKELKDIFFSVDSYVRKAEDIERFNIPGGGGGYEMRSYANTPKAKIRGFEIDLQTQLVLVPFIPTFLKGIVLNANYARIWSETYYYRTETEPDYSQPWPWPTLYTDIRRKGRMPGQAEQILNISLGYDVGGFSSRVSILYQGKSLESVGVLKEEDDWDDDFWRWDASAKYKLHDWISFNLNLSHIGGQPDRTFFGQSNRQTRRSYYGMTASAGIQFTYGE